VVFITLTYPNDLIAGIEVSWLKRLITLVGEKRCLPGTMASGSVTIYDKRIIREPYNYSYSEFQLLAHEGDITIPKHPAEEPLKRQARFFIEALAKKNATVCSGELGWDVVRTLEAINNSIRNGGAAGSIESHETVYS
jgi:predicted dehydrogenase